MNRRLFALVACGLGVGLGLVKYGRRIVDRVDDWLDWWAAPERSDGVISPFEITYDGHAAYYMPVHPALGAGVTQADLEALARDELRRRGVPIPPHFRIEWNLDPLVPMGDTMIERGESVARSGWLNRDTSFDERTLGL